MSRDTENTSMGTGTSHVTHEHRHQKVTDHERVVSSGGWLGAAAACAFLGWCDAQLPAMAGWALNSAVILAVAYAMAAWKDVWYGWLAFWGLALCCLASMCLNLAGAASLAVGTPIAAVYLFAWYWLVRTPKRQRRTEPAPQVVHIVHTCPGMAGPAYTATVLPPEPVRQVARRSPLALPVPPVVRRALDPGQKDRVAR